MNRMTSIRPGAVVTRSCADKVSPGGAAAIGVNTAMRRLNTPAAPTDAAE